MATPDSSTALDGVQPDPDMWFEDGNVIVIAQQTAFRFHRGALSRHSEAFRGLFSVPQPTSSGSVQTMDGCPVIHVTDTAYDFRHLLRAVYDGASVFSGVEPMEFGALASIVRMGHKYQVDAILDEALRRLNTVYTSDFATWDENEGGSTALITVRVADGIEAVNLFLLVGRKDMLVAAFYMCGLLDVDHLIDGIPRADGTLERLSTYDLQRCLTAQMALVKHDARILAELLHTDAPADCTCPSKDFRRTLLDARHADVVSALHDILDPLPIHSTYGVETIDDLEAEGLCDTCGEALRAHHTALRRDLWGRLPAFFRLLE
ncbi:hypothetical protein K466DRAFT_496187 [Polyporus arcularius HHB13444]|uniref:BTB domain-containing protein n=1 Tax=Polyporus arcularius HHB13444 TaxID=1314778 RepID=A0A5C3P4Q8_9APHY|nr:hypothetical protein K466DRAFT_496187 [Polyporus arcularius HHB13444]